MILIVSTQFDPHVDFVIDEIRRRRLSFARFNTEDFPTEASVAVEYNAGIDLRESYIIIPANPTIRLDAVRSVWYRRPEVPEVDARITSDAVRGFAEAEAQSALDGLWEIIDGLWINRPAAIRRTRKLAQLVVAHELGFNIPRTLVTNEPARVLDFFAACQGNVVCKTLREGTINYPGHSTAIYTHRCSPEDLELLESVSLAPSIFQEYVPKSFELRITVVGRRVMAAAIDSQLSPLTRDDWRRYDFANVPHSVHQMPDDVEEKCRSIVARFGLVFGAIDMIVTPEGEYIFLEVNPNGQWAWIEGLTGLPICSALVDLLAADT